MIYVYVTTWSTVDYTSVMSIMHCRPCCNKLISSPSQTWSVTVKSIGVGHVTLGWTEIMSGYNTPDTVVKHRRRK